MAKGFINVSHSGNGSIDYYGRDEECIGWRHSNKSLEDLEEVKQIWKQLEQNEKLGNKDLGIRGRHDARVRTNYVLSLPNTLSPKEAADKIQEIINQSEIKNCTYTMFLHRGEKDKVKNLHMHLIVNERDLTTGKKDRIMQRKEWLEKKFRPLYEKTFAKEFEEAPNYARRERLEVGLYQSNVQEAKNIVQGIYRASDEKDRTLPTQEELRAMKHDEFQIWRSYEFWKKRAEQKGEEFKTSWKSFREEKMEAQKREQEQRQSQQKKPSLGL